MRHIRICSFLTPGEGLVESGCQGDLCRLSDRSIGIYSVLIITGYLTAIRTDGDEAVNPNREMFGVYIDMIIFKLDVNG